MPGGLVADLVLDTSQVSAHEAIMGMVKRDGPSFSILRPSSRLFRLYVYPVGLFYLTTNFIATAGRWLLIVLK